MWHLFAPIVYQYNIINHCACFCFTWSWLGPVCLTGGSYLWRGRHIYWSHVCRIFCGVFCTDWPLTGLCMRGELNTGGFCKWQTWPQSYPRVRISHMRPVIKFLPRSLRIQDLLMKTSGHYLWYECCAASWAKSRYEYGRKNFLWTENA